VIESKQVDGKTKTKLRQLYEMLNPTALRRKLDELRAQLESVNSTKEQRMQKPAHRGPDLDLRSRSRVAAAQ